MANSQEALKSGNRMQYRCSFCGKGQDEVVRLIAGPGAVYICDECVELCRQIINEEAEPTKSDPESERFQRERMLTSVLLEVTPKEIMRDPRFIADALSGHRDWMFNVGSNGDVRMLINVSGDTIANILQSLGEANEQSTEG